MDLLTRDEILGYDDLHREELVIPEWGNRSLYVRVMSGAEKDWWEASMFSADGEQLPINQRVLNMRARMAVVTVCDAQGTALFCLADVELLAKKAATALDRIWDVAKRLNKLTQEEEDTLLKNSAPGQSAGPGSDLP